MAGVWDMFHAGHHNLLVKAADLGDVVVGVVTDRGAANYKDTPIIPYDQREKIVRNLRGVIHTEPFTSKYGKDIGWGYRRAIRCWRPDFVLHGDDWNSGVLKGEREVVEEELAKYGGRLVEVPYTQGISTTLIKEKIWTQKANTK